MKSFQNFIDEGKNVQKENTIALLIKNVKKFQQDIESDMVDV